MPSSFPVVNLSHSDCTRDANEGAISFRYFILRPLRLAAPPYDARISKDAEIVRARLCMLDDMVRRDRFRPETLARRILRQRAQQGCCRAGSAARSRRGAGTD